MRPALIAVAAATLLVGTVVVDDVQAHRALAISVPVWYLPLDGAPPNYTRRRVRTQADATACRSQLGSYVVPGAVTWYVDDARPREVEDDCLRLHPTFGSAR